MGFSTVRKKYINEILMRKSACSNFASNDYFLDLTSLNSFVFAGMCLQGVRVRTVSNTLQATAMTVLEKKHGFTVCLDERLKPDHLLSAEEQERLSDVLWPLAASHSSSHFSALSIYPWSHLPSSFRAGAEALDLVHLVLQKHVHLIRHSV